MSLVSQAFPPQLSRKRLTALAFGAVALGASYKLAQFIVQGDFSGLAYTGMLFVGCAFVLSILSDWSRGIYLLLAWILFEDLGRKFLGNNMAIFFAKDFLLLVVYLSFFIAWRRRSKDLQTFRPPFCVALAALVWFGAIQVLNPASTTVFFGFMGMKLYFYYVPMMFLGYALVKSEKALRQFFMINLSLVLIIVALGIAQSILGPRFLNPAIIADDIRLLSETYRVAPISGVRVYRPTSVFVSTGRFADMLIVSWIMVFGFSGYLLLRHRRGRTFAFVALAITAAGCLMCASRGVFMWSLGSAVVGGLAFFWGAPWRQGEALRVLRSLQRSILGITLAVAALMFFYPEPFLNRIAVYSETLDPRSPASELLYRTRDYPLKNFLAAFTYERWLFGYGIGTASLGNQYIARFFHATPPVNSVENGFGCLVVEMGIGGLVLWLTMASAVVLSGWRVVRKLRGSPLFPIGFMIFLYSFLLLFPMTFEGIQPYQDFIMNAYLWLLIGILFRLPKLRLDAPLTAAAGSDSRWIR